MNKKILGYILISAVSFCLGWFFSSEKKYDTGYGLSESEVDKKITQSEEKGFFLKNFQGLAFDADSLTAAASKSRKKNTIPTSSVGTTTSDSFSSVVTIDETGAIGSSSSSRWWVNSGGRFVVNNNVGKTLFGNLSSNDLWYKEYLSSNPVDTDNGLHPQNIFRLVEREYWKNYTQQVYFNISKINVSASPNRNASNGVLLFNRYQSGDNLYYVGVRVDGAAVIKKKLNGIYYTMAYTKIFNGTYNQNTNENLIPLNSWIGVKSEVKDLSNGDVSIKLFVDNQRSGTWTEVLSTIDSPGLFGPSVVSSQGYAGIRTDFMDVAFDDYLIKAI
ncbi:MAG: hypothetical protein KBC42_02090 [Candidatus Pacebacteria bacterium]|nr:hypothetical protein [Candidatus Paceibacterota bacterium]MBP9780693.1 hypothetical protein [Candidatus Paceibacterota bacterium]